LNSQSNPQKKEQSWKYHNTWLQTILQSHTNKKSMIWTWKKTWRPIEQNIRTRYKSTQLQPSDFWQNICWRNYNFFNTWSWKSGYLKVQKTETRPLSLTLY
jgi:hypothetical protein